MRVNAYLLRPDTSQTLITQQKSLVLVVLTPTAREIGNVNFVIPENTPHHTDIRFASLAESDTTPPIFRLANASLVPQEDTEK